MTGLLVSVRDSTEALAALNGGADVIDIKEPRAGSLGAAEVGTWHKISHVVAAAKPISVALGELQDDAVFELARQAGGMQFAKIGLSCCKDDCDWSTRWHRAIACLPNAVASAAVIYADHVVAGSPLPEVIVQQAIEFECAAILFDTYSKTNGNLFDYLGEQQLRPLCREARRVGMKVVLAGSLRGDLVLRGLGLEPDYIAVRGAVCRGDRRAAVDQSLIKSLADIVHDCSSAAC